MSGYLMPVRVSGPMPPMGTGFIPTTEQPGFLIIPGDGQPSIMADGVMMITTDGNGSPDTNGPLLGWAGATAVNITAGLLWGQDLV